MTYVIFELCKNPQVHTKLLTEINGLFTPGKEFTFEDLTSAKYLDSVIKETLRLHPVVPTLGKLSSLTIQEKERSATSSSMDFLSNEVQIYLWTCMEFTGTKGTGVVHLSSSPNVGLQISFLLKAHFSPLQVWLN